MQLASSCFHVEHDAYLHLDVLQISVIVISRMKRLCGMRKNSGFCSVVFMCSMKGGGIQAPMALSLLAYSTADLACIFGQRESDRRKGGGTDSATTDRAAQSLAHSAWSVELSELAALYETGQRVSVRPYLSSAQAIFIRQLASFHLHVDIPPAPKWPFSVHLDESTHFYSRASFCFFSSA